MTPGQQVSARSGDGIRRGVRPIHLIGKTSQRQERFRIRGIPLRPEGVYNGQRSGKSQTEMPCDCWEVLGVAPGASPEEIKKAFREQVKRCHPDVCPAPDAGRRLEALLCAYQRALALPRRSPRSDVLFSTRGTSYPVVVEQAGDAAYKRLCSRYFWLDWRERATRFAQTAAVVTLLLVPTSVLLAGGTYVQPLVARAMARRVHSCDSAGSGIAPYTVLRTSSGWVMVLPDSSPNTDR